VRSNQSRCAACIMAALLLTAAGGCHSYEAKPIDAAAHRAAFLARTPDAPEVAEYARSLAAAGGRAASTDLNPDQGAMP